MSLLSKTGVGQVAVVILHLVFLASVFDIYFRSPVVSVGGIRYRPDYVGSGSGEAPAKRVVIFVADGLRADSLYARNVSSWPFLRKVLSQMGSWGVSHTRVPTESRPGHVALLAGMYEDPSAITRGWKENPVNFDTVFNASRYSWSWGSPDILPMFAKGATLNHMEADFYGAEFEDFSSSDPSDLDQWVFDKVKAFMDKQGQSEDLRRKLRQDKLILFLHLLGLDTNGHTNKPHSRMYDRNLRLVDAGVRDSFRLLENYWGHDGRTAYIFTADHGMTDWGSHGAGSAHETETPILVWGAGLRPPQSAPHSRNLQTQSWGLDKYHRTDVNQTDVAPLISSLLGISVPQHSVGKLPRSMLKMHPKAVLEAYISNVRQLHAQVESFRERFERAAFHKNFEKLDQTILDTMVKKANRLGAQNRYEAALEQMDKAFDLCTEGLSYYQRYHRFSLFTATTASYIGFSLLVIVRLVKNYTGIHTVGTHQKPPSSLYGLNIVSMLAAFGAFVFVILQNLPVQFYLYFGCPVAVWHFVARDLMSFNWPVLSAGRSSVIGSILQTFILPALILEFLIAAFFERKYLSVAIGINSFWKLSANPKASGALKTFWAVMCMVLAAFSFQPSVSNEKSPTFPVAAGVASALFATFLSIAKKGVINQAVTLHSVLSLLASGVLVYVSDFRASSCHALAWILFVTSLPISLMTSSSKAGSRLIALCTALQTMYVLLSVTYEGLFALCLMVTMGAWIRLTSNEANLSFEMSSATYRERDWISVGDVGTALDFVFFAVVSFFGVGNIASLNSFNPKSIATLVSVFNPFLMGALLLLKVLIPFLMVALFVTVTRKYNRCSRNAMFLMVLLMSDFMALHFFFLVSDQGSWQEIGTSLSHYVIAQATVIFLQVFSLLADFLLSVKGVLYKENCDVQDLNDLTKFPFKSQ